MPSPFPGMNPYLEQDDVWHDFHQRFVTVLADAIGEAAPSEYIVKIDENVYVHDLTDADRILLGKPDDFVAIREDSDASLNGGTGLATIAPPLVTRWPEFKDTERVPYVEIRDREDRRVVTVVELLSPSNKRAGSDREQYIGKRNRLFRSTTHLVEIDVLRGLPRMPLAALPDCDYCIVVSRAEQRPDVGVWPLGLRDRLPVIPVPLQEPHADVVVDLQDVLHSVYDRARYENYVYRGRPNPLLRAGDAEWAEEIVASLR